MWQRCDERLALKGGETYLVILQIITVVFVIKIFLRLTAMPYDPAEDYFYILNAELNLWLIL